MCKKVQTFSLLVCKSWPGPQLAFTQHIKISVEHGKPIKHLAEEAVCSECIQFVVVLDLHVMSAISIDHRLIVDSAM